MKRCLTILAGLLVGLVLTAAPVTKDAARQKALQFLTERGSGVAASRGVQPVNLQLRDAAGVDQLYVFNVGQQNGFVIVSGDDCTGDLVLGYADSGEITTDNMPDNMRAWLQGYADQIRWMQANGVTNDVAGSRGIRKMAVRSSVSPMLTTLWDQEAPYSTYCNSGNSPTGCVATAVAQILCYHGRRLGTTTTTLKVIDAYTTKTNGYSVAAKPIRTFDWSKLSDTYPSTTTANEEVARLMEYVGAGLEMDYKTSVSSASNSDVPAMLTKYFGYDQDIKRVSRNDYLYADWLDLIYNELTTNGPVLYGGQSTGGGHSFVLDGYENEDYFHINWGWSGNGNGVYKLSVCYSSTQGTGGNSSKTGYSFYQDAIVNVNPVDDGVTESKIRMTLQEVSVGSTAYHRASAASDFSGVVISSRSYNFTGSTHSFNFGWMLYEEDSNTLIDSYYTGGQSLDANYGLGLVSRTVSFGAGLADGEYRLVPVSREHGTLEWLDDFDSQRYYVKATISGTELTLEAMGTVSLSATLATSGNMAGQPVTVTATVTNNGSTYSGDLVLTQNGYYAAAKQVEIEAGATKDVVFTFTPSSAGSCTIQLQNKQRNLVAQTAVTIIASDATAGTLTATNGDITFENGIGSYKAGFYGSKLIGHINVTNTSTTADHTNGVVVRIWQHVSGTSYSLLRQTTYASNVLRNNGTQQIDFEFDNLTVGTSYFLSFYYISGNSLNGFLQTSSFNSNYGITSYTADGTATTVAPSASVTVAADVVALDISQINGVTSVTPNSNPNTLYIIGTNTPTGLDGKNVVVNGTAETLTLVDGYGFFSPVEFNATTATYTRQFTVGADGTQGWSTIVVPFDVSSVKQGAKAIDWFHSSSDTGKNFWLKSFSSEHGDIVNFDFADQLQANTPYIIAVPGDKWGAKWNLTNKDITFEGSGVTIAATMDATASGNNYRFTGVFSDQPVTNCYVLNSSGTTFEKVSTAVNAFRAYFKPLDMLANGALANRLPIGVEPVVTAVTSVPEGVDQSADQYYNLNGQRVQQLGKGLYIIDGKKVIIK